MVNLNNLKQHLPPGLEDNGVEFYFFGNVLKCLHQGVRYTWGEFPEWILHKIEEDMLAHPDAMKALVNWDLTQREEMIYQYIICRFGGFDNSADITEAGDIAHTEYFDCGRRGHCAQEGKLCSAIKVGDEHLTKQEINVLKKVTAGKSNKVIAAELHISEETVSSHNQNIQRKLGVASKTEMATWAILKNIVE